MTGTDGPGFDRRRVLRTGALLGATAGLAGCSGGGTDTATEAAETEAEETGVDASTATATDTAGGAAAFPQGTCLASITADVPTPAFGFEFERGPNPTVPDTSATTEGAVTVADGTATFGEGGGSITVPGVQGPQDLTVSLFARTAVEATDQWDVMVHYTDASEWTGWGVDHRGEIVDFWAQGPAEGSTQYTAQSSSGLPVDSWAHVLAVKRGSDMLLYVDGEQVASSTFGSEAIDYGSGQVDLVVGDHRTRDGRWFRGALDSIAIWDSALAPAEVQSVLSTAGNCR